MALVHDWLTGMRGGERVLEVFLDLYPGAEIFTLFHVPGTVSAAIESRPIHTSFVNRLPVGDGKTPWFLPLYPLAIESFDLRGFDLVISTSHCVAKGVLAPPEALHLCYCFSPMRYAYDQAPAYRRAVPWWARPGWDAVLAGLRVWDAGSAPRPDRFVAISEHVAQRIRRAYGLEPRVLGAPIDLGAFPGPPAEPVEGTHYLVLSALVPYKRIDLVVDAAPRLPYPVRIAGSGKELERLRSRARGNVEFLGWVDEAEKAELIAGSRALLFPGEEDWGLVPLEVNAQGKPVVGYGRGGLAETQVEGETAVFHPEQTVDSLVDAVLRAETVDWDPAAIRRHAERFSVPWFQEEWTRIVEEERERRSRPPGLTPRGGPEGA